MNLKKYIVKGVKAILPHGVVALHRCYKRKQRPNAQVVENASSATFWSGYMNYVRDKAHRVKFVESCPFQHVIAVHGFGYSGSGAVLDLLREYDCNIVVGDVDNEGTVMKRPTTACYEVTFMTDAGGLFEIERYLNSNNIVLNDALLHRFILLIEKSQLYQEVPQVRPYLYEFLDQILEVNIPYSSRQYFNMHIDYEGNYCMLFLKHMSVEKYRELCRKLLYSIFDQYHTDKKLCNLVLDHFMGDYEYDYKRYEEYLPELKTIYVYRDLRDIYTFAKSCKEEWLPSEVNLFVKWCKIKYKNFEPAHMNNSLIVRFEDLVRDYANEVSRVEAYLHIDSSHHQYPYSAMDPKVSIRNVGIWKQHPEYIEDYKMIGKEFQRLLIE